MKKIFINVTVAITIVANSLSYIVVQAKTTNDSEDLKKQNILNEFKANKDKSNYKKNEIIVKVKDKNNLKSIQSSDIKTEKDLSEDMILISFDESKEDMEQVLTKLNEQVGIEYAEPNYRRELTKSPLTEPYADQLWGLKNNTNPGIDINVVNVWNRTLGSRDVVVGILDSGIEYDHEDLTENIWTNSKEIPDNGIDDDGNGYIDDYYGWDFLYKDNNPRDFDGHGTHVSGTIAAAQNDLGVVGVAPNVKVMSLRVGEGRWIYTSETIEAIKYATNKGVRIFNCSYGSDKFSQAEFDIIKNSNALFLAAAGNGDANGNGLNNDVTSVYPANYELNNIISVASINEEGNLSKFSNYGAKTVDIAAPGEHIGSTIPYNSEYGYYATMSGTSMATPHVTGVAALLLSYNPNASISDLRSYLLNGAHKLTSLNGKVGTGGIIDATASLVAMDPSVGALTNIGLNMNNLTLKKGAQYKLTETITPTNSIYKDVKWTSSNSNIVVVDDTGKVSALNEGNAVITVQSAYNNKIMASCNINVSKYDTAIYRNGDTFTLKVYTPEVLNQYADAYFIKPNGKEQRISLVPDSSNGYYYNEFNVTEDEGYYDEINPVLDYGTWELKNISLSYGNTYYNEKYYEKSNTIKTWNFDRSKFTIESLDNKIIDNTNDLSNNSKQKTNNDITELKSVVVSKKDVYNKEVVQLRFYAKDTSGIGEGSGLYMYDPLGNEVYFNLESNQREGYYYVDIYIGSDYNSKYYNSIDPQSKSGVWTVKQLMARDVNEEYTVYTSEEPEYEGDIKYNFNNASFNVRSYQNTAKTTDVNGDGVTDIFDMAIMGSKYNTKRGYGTYLDALDVNSDGIIDIYDLVKLSTNMI
ncbi:S8 family serine peptidase [Clostridium intestinale]|uniref:Serine protease, subtilisin family n=1 Tax=Clostridium intestinale DSM 6191 TaxID=1121320 RepID=A0A1M6FGU5_9CLOT|nr:S8 family serine peptidase [Clostridium intestinale]SHI96873.1 Serine protease, subtilisin family [Clostridium intestinale DSM 6191]